MKNALELEMVFNHPGFGEVRTIVKEGGETWFVAKDVATALKHENPERAVRNFVDEEDKMVIELSTKRGKQNTICINECGVYSLVFQSETEFAKKFKYWIAHEVLPSIHKKGYYSPLSDLELLKMLVERCGEDSPLLTDEYLMQYKSAVRQQRIEQKQKEMSEAEEKLRGFVSQKRLEWQTLIGKEADEFLSKSLEECKTRFPEFEVWGLLPNQFRKMDMLQICVPYSYLGFHSLSDQERLAVIRDAIGEE